MSLPDGYVLTAEIPPIDDYLRLRVMSGLTPKPRESAEIGLPRSHHGVVVRHGDQVVGMGRLIGDGGLFLQVVDIAVDPAHQGKGIGKAVVSALVDHVRATTPPGAYVSLMADGEAWKLYSQYGFEPTAPRSIGMAFVTGRAPAAADAPETPEPR